MKAPPYVSLADIELFIARKAQWIRKKQQEQQALLEAMPVWRFESGAVFPYLGKQLRLEVNWLNEVRPDFAQLETQGHQLVLQCYLGKGRRMAPERRIHSLLVNWYQQQAGLLLGQKTRAYAHSLGVSVGHISLKATKSKWGHCTLKGDIQYNWQIVLAPEPVVDYLVAHEVSHRLELNHSERFWNWVSRLCPDYKAHRHWLKSHGQKLVI